MHYHVQEVINLKSPDIGNGITEINYFEMLENIVESPGKLPQCPKPLYAEANEYL